MANADHVRRITAMLNNNGCTPAEAQARLAKARQIAEREGLLHQFPQLRTPEELAAVKAAKASSAQAKAKASAAYHSARAAKAPPSWGGFESVEINGVKVDLGSLSNAGLDVLATLLRKQQQEQSARNYHRQREQVTQRQVDAYVAKLKKEEDAERARHFQAKRRLWARLAVAVAVLFCALLVNRIAGGPMAFVAAWLGLNFVACSVTSLQFSFLAQEHDSTMADIAYKKRYAQFEYGYR